MHLCGRARFHGRTLRFFQEHRQQDVLRQVGDASWRHCLPVRLPFAREKHEVEKKEGDGEGGEGGEGGNT